jgi:alanyl-tRNA synthetase
VVGVPADRIQRLDKDNFWQAGDTGPCGPCSELFYDKGPAYGAEGGPAFGGEERYLEFWNLVFMQYDQQPDGTRLALPRPSIDTGAGLERILVLLQDVDSVWDIDEFVALGEAAQSVTGVVGGRDPIKDVSLRILVDHARATTLLVSDGVFPSNEGRGYVLRRILRRAVRHAYLLGVERPVMASLVDAVVDVMGPSYPELVRSQDFVRGVIGREEERFRHTLRSGSVLLDEALAGVPQGGTLAGDVAFQLHDTFGFPLEVTQEITAERGIEVDDAGFETAMSEQRRRAKAARKGVEADRWFDAYQELVEQFGPTEYLARQEVAATARVLAVIGGPGEQATDGSSDDEGGLPGLFLDRTPFYAEAGGQVGDTGTIETDTGTARVLRTSYALPGLVRHEIEVIDGQVTAGQEARALVDVVRRDAIRRNHTGTHLLHWALRKVLGEHVRQQGSLVAPERLRFDFSHYEPVTDGQLAEIEDLVAGEVLANHPVRAYETTKAHADEVGALAFFGDKYGDIVRVVEAGPSVELCGGTHVRATGDIGSVKVVAEGSIGSNIRRIEAVTGFDTVLRLRDLESRWRQAAERLNVPVDEVLVGIDRRLGELRTAQAEVKALRQQLVSGRVEELVAEARDGALVARLDGMPRDEYRQMALTLRNRPGIRAVVLGGAADGGGVALVAAVMPGSGLNAGELIADGARLIKGGGGRGDELAVAGGKEIGGLDDALDTVRAQLGLHGGPTPAGLLAAGTDEGSAT